MIPLHQLSLLKDSFATIYQEKARVGDRCYRRLFAEAPELQTLFEDRFLDPQQMLVRELALIVRAASEDTPLPQICRLATAHRAMGLTDRDYDLMREALVAAISDVMSGAFPKDTADAWRMAFDHMIRPMRDAAAPEDVPPPAP